MREESFQPTVVKDVEAFTGIDFPNAPPLLGYVATIAKETSEVLLEAEEEMPLLARWQYGLGKTVAFTSDVKNRWAAEWLTWDGYGKFWPQMVRETMRRRDDENIDLRIEKEDDEAHIVITAFDDEGGFRNELDSQVRVVDPRQNTSVSRCSPIGARDLRGPLPSSTSAVPSRSASLGMKPAWSAPFPTPIRRSTTSSLPTWDLLQRSRCRDRWRVRSRERPTSSRPRDRAPPRPIPLWPYLAFVALLLYLTDLLLRRVRLFEGVDRTTRPPARPLPAQPARWGFP